MTSETRDRVLKRPVLIWLLVTAAFFVLGVARTVLLSQGDFADALVVGAIVASIVGLLFGIVLAINQGRND